MNPFKFAIIGAGPSAYAAVKALKDQGHKEKILIISGISNKDYSYKARKLSLKNTLNIQNNFVFPDESIHYKNILLASSNSVGGFSNSWGAVFKPSKNFDNIPTIQVNSLYRGTKSQDFYNQTDRLININQNISLAIDKNKCTFCGKCINGCDYEAIWNSGEMLRGDPQITIITTNRLEKLDINFFNKNRYFRFKNLSQEVFLAKNVIICAGIVSSSIIALNTFPEINELTFEQNDLRIGIFFQKSQNKNKEPLSLAQNALKLKIDTSLNIYGQIYSNLQQIKFQLNARSKLISLIPNFFWELFTKYLNVIFIYLPSSKSTVINLTRSPEGNILKYNCHRTNNRNWLGELLLFRKIVIYCKNLKIRFLPYWGVTTTGYSFHVSGSKKNYIPKNEFILFADGLTFINEEPDNFTSKLMEHVYNDVKNWKLMWQK